METAETWEGYAIADAHVKGESHHEHEAHHHHGHDHASHHHEEPISKEEAVQSLLTLGQVATDAGDFESAVEAFASILKLEPNEAAFYNLGSFHARGLGVRQDFVEAARLFHQAELLGNERAGKLCAKCMFDYLLEGLDKRRPADLYAEMAVFVTRVYPEASDQHKEVNSGLFAVASTLANRGSYAEAAKVFRAAAEFGNDGRAQYYLAVLYNSGAGLQENDLAALYWLDCAVDNGAVELALVDRDGMLAAYRQSLSANEFQEMMAALADWCESGTPDVPVDPEKAARWRELA
jgi:TPR repeat protein